MKTVIYLDFFGVVVPPLAEYRDGAYHNVVFWEDETHQRVEKFLRAISELDNTEVVWAAGMEGEENHLNDKLDIPLFGVLHGVMLGDILDREADQAIHIAQQAKRYLADICRDHQVTFYGQSIDPRTGPTKDQLDRVLSIAIRGEYPYREEAQDQ